MKCCDWLQRLLDVHLLTHSDHRGRASIVVVTVFVLDDMVESAQLQGERAVSGVKFLIGSPNRNVRGAFKRDLRTEQPGGRRTCRLGSVR